MINADPRHIELRPNWVLLEFDLAEHEDISATLESGIKIDKRWDKYQYAVVRGKVAKTCSELYYTDDKDNMHEAPLEYQSPLEIREGDLAFYNYLSGEKAIKTGRIIRHEDKHYLILRYDRLYAVFRDGEWYGINGWKICARNDANEQTEGFIQSRTWKLAHVLGVGSPVKDYWDKLYPETGWIQRGQVIRYSSAIPVENKWLSEFGDIVRVREKDVLMADFTINPYCISFEPLSRNEGVGFQIEGVHMRKGKAITPFHNIAIGDEFLYFSEYQYTENNQHFLTRAHCVTDFNGQKLVMPV